MSGRRARAALAGIAVVLVVAAALAGAAYQARKTIHWRLPAGTVRRGTLAVRTLGRSGPPVVLLHGFIGSGRYWGAAFDALAEDHRLLVPDLLGFGASPKPASGYGADEHAGAVAAALAEAGVDEPVVIGAHSFGTLVALRLAVLRPGLVASIVAFGPPLYPSPEAARQRLAATGPFGGMLASESRWMRGACIWFHSHPRAAAALVRLARPGLPAPIARDATRHTWRSYSESMRRVLLPAEGAAWIGEIDVPVRLVLGAKDAIADPEFLAALARRYEHVSFRRVEGAGHDLPLTHPELCLAELRRAPAPEEPEVPRWR